MKKLFVILDIYLFLVSFGYCQDTTFNNDLFLKVMKTTDYMTNVTNGKNVIIDYDRIGNISSFWEGYEYDCYVRKISEITPSGVKLLEKIIIFFIYDASIGINSGKFVLNENYFLKEFSIIEASNFLSFIDRIKQFIDEVKKARKNQEIEYNSSDGKFKFGVYARLYPYRFGDEYEYFYKGFFNIMDKLITFDYKNIYKIESLLKNAVIKLNE
jgi:hypothetical protein